MRKGQGRMAIAREDALSTAAAPVALLGVKAVPGAKTESVVGVLGDRLKIRVRQPPEGGRANAAIVAILARELGIGEAMLSIVRGETTAEKTLRVRSVSAEAINAKWVKE